MTDDGKRNGYGIARRAGKAENKNAQQIEAHEERQAGEKTEEGKRQTAFAARWRQATLAR